MDTQTQGHGDKPRTKYVIGMDAHSRKLAISIWEWSDPWNPVLARNVKCFAISEIKEVYGEEEERAKKKGGTGKPLDTEGRRDLKYYFCEAGQTVLNKCCASRLGKWGTHLIFSGKERNKVVCAVGRRLTPFPSCRNRSMGGRPCHNIVLHKTRIRAKFSHLPP